MNRSYSPKSIRPEMTVRQIAVDLPASRDVFLDYGESDNRPGQFGHFEPLTHFARRHHIELKNLLSELSAATAAPVEIRSRYAERVHHGFVLSSLLITLTIGAGWGTWLLWKIEAGRNFGLVPAGQIVAHGEAQWWGFISLFIMSISLRTVLQAVPQQPLGKWACRGLLTLGMLGIVGSFLWFLLPEAFAAIGVAAAMSLLFMSGSYLAMQLAVLRGKWTKTWARGVLASGLWLVVWAFATAWLRWQAGSAGPGGYSETQRLLLIELAVFGFALNSIYGFGQMLLPGLLRTGTTRSWAIELSHWVHNIGAAIVCLSAILEWPSAPAAGCALLAAAAVLFAVGNRGFVGRRRSSQRDEQGYAPLDAYPPLAFLWLVASLVLMTCGFLYEMTIGSPLPHAYMGAVRHALTVGFMTTLILGVGQRLLPVFDHTVLARPRFVVPILVLIGVGNAMRVGAELAILSTPAAYAVMPLSGVLEWCALLLFAFNAVATMYHTDPLISQGCVSSRSSLAVLLAEYPVIEDRLIAAGSKYLERARSIPSELTIGSFAESEGYSAAEYVNRINAWVREIPGNAQSADGRRTH